MLLNKIQSDKVSSKKSVRHILLFSPSACWIVLRKPLSVRELTFSKQILSTSLAILQQITTKIKLRIWFQNAPLIYCSISNPLVLVTARGTEPQKTVKCHSWPSGNLQPLWSCWVVPSERRASNFCAWYQRQCVQHGWARTLVTTVCSQPL